MSLSLHVRTYWKAAEFDETTNTWTGNGYYNEAECVHCKARHSFSADEHHSRWSAEKAFSDVHDCPKLVKCEHCGDVLAKRSLKKHQEGLACQASKLSKHLEANGKAKLSWWLTKDLFNHFTDQSEQLIFGEYLKRDRRSGLKKEGEAISKLSHQEIAHVKNTANDVLAYVKEIIGYEEHLTCYCRGGWGGNARREKEAWISSEYHYLFEKFFARWDVDAIYHLIRYHENPHERESIICLLELRKEARGEE